MIQNNNNKIYLKCRLLSHRENPTVDRNLPHRQKAKSVRRKYLPNWEDVLSNIPQGSVFGPTLCVVFISDMPDVMTSISKMFADDAKVLRQIETSADTATCHNDLNHLTDWSLKW